MQHRSGYWATIGAILAGLAVVMGAFGAHGVDRYFADKYAEIESKTIAGFQVPAAYKYLQDFQTGAQYQMYHALGLIAVGLLSRIRPSRAFQVAGWSFLLGILVFSGSLYILTLSGQTWWGAITPIGGTLMIVGWIALAIGASSLRGNSAPGKAEAGGG